MYREDGGKGGGASPAHGDTGIRRRLTTCSGALWQRLLFNMAKVLRRLPGPEEPLVPGSLEPSRELDAVRVALLTRGEPLMRLESALSLSTQELKNKIRALKVERVVFRFYRSLPEFVWNAGALEGNPFTFLEVKALLDGVTLGGRKVADAEQILNLADSSHRLIDS